MNQKLRSDRFVWEAIQTWGDSVYRLALCRTHNPSDAEDVFQDVFLRLLTDPTEFESAEHLKAWLLRVTIHRSRDLITSAWFKKTTALDELLPAQEVMADESGLWEAMAALPQKYATVLHLFYVEGYSTEEIAEITHLKPTTARTRLYRARQLLKKKIGGYQDETYRLSGADDKIPCQPIAQGSDL